MYFITVCLYRVCMCVCVLPQSVCVYVCVHLYTCRQSREVLTIRGDFD